ncbi:MAG: S8 family peptidase [Actinomycetota bacterium]|nr:S8 family peptidase [Actinomycetota bacterium]
MKYSKSVVILLALLFVVSIFSSASGAGAGPYRAIVIYQAGIGPSKRAELVGSVGGIRQKDLSLIKGEAVVLPDKAAATELAKRPGVLRVDEDIILTATARKSSVSQPPQVLPWGVDRIDADLVWSPPASANGAGVNVAVIDTGIQLNHPDLSANIKGGFNAINSHKSANDDNGHGTHVAGTIAGAANTIGVVGVGPSINLYAVKVLGAGGSGWLSDVIEGLQWAANTHNDTDPLNDIQVANMSFGSSGANDSEHDAIIAANNAGVTLVAAAGNSSGGAVGYPAAYDEVIAVSATTAGDTLASFSSVGPEVDLAAPGSNIFSTYKRSGYAYLSGTSMASPHVTGSAALVIGAKGPLTPARVKALLQLTADPLPGLTANQQGAGLVDAEEAVTTTTIVP